LARRRPSRPSLRQRLAARLAWGLAWALTPPRLWRPLVLAAPIAYLGLALLAAGVRLGALYAGILEEHAVLADPFEAEGIGTLVTILQVSVILAGLGFVAAGFTGMLWRRLLALSLLRKACMTGYVLFGLYVYVVYTATGVVLDYDLEVGGPVDAPIMFGWRWAMLWPAGLAVLLLVPLYVYAWLTETIEAFTGRRPESPTRGDEIKEEMREAGLAKGVLVGACVGVICGLFKGHDTAMIQTAGYGMFLYLPAWILYTLLWSILFIGIFALVSGGVFVVGHLVGGRDRAYQESVFSSAWTHLLVIVLIPWWLSMLGCIRPYRIPEGSGDPVVQLVAVVQPKQVEKKKLIANPESPIYIHMPDIEEIEREVKEMTEKVYEADPTRLASGAMGQGGGDEGGWPDGMGNEPIRFIRLKYGARGWNDAMDSGPDGNADLNLLNFLDEQAPDRIKVAERVESIRIRDLARFPEGFAPPFVYMTGDSGFHISSRDTKILREHLMNGGLLFASAMSPGWHRQFKSYVESSLFPGESFRVIADDDPVHRSPNVLTHGPPPVQSHGGSQPLGIRKQGRWVVYYHPGDLHDAWRDGHAGFNKKVVEDAYATGVNVIVYSFNKYLEATRGTRR